MDTIKIRTAEEGVWITVKLLPGERAGWVEVGDDAGARWVALDDVHPADQVALRFEQQARERYKWVPRFD